MGEEDIHISAWDLKRKYEVCNFGRKVVTHWPLKRRAWSTGHSSKPVGFLVCVLWPLHYFTKSVPTTEERYVQTLGMYSYCTQTLPSKNENINYIFIYLRVFRCLSSSATYDTIYKIVILILFIFYFWRRQNWCNFLHKTVGWCSRMLYHSGAMKYLSLFQNIFSFLNIVKSSLLTNLSTSCQSSFLLLTSK